MAAAGFTVIPNSILAAAKGSGQSKAVSFKKLASYQIVVPDQATAVEQETADKLQHYIAQLTHQDLPQRKEAEYRSGAAFFIGRTRYAKSRGVNFNELEEDGFALYPAGKGLILAGGTGKGTLYSVYGLLELWGFRMYTSKAIAIPDVSSVSIPNNPVVVIPAVRYRTTSYGDTSDPEYTNWHQLSSRDDWGLFVHTFNTLVPPEQYGTAHPEYFLSSTAPGCRERNSAFPILKSSISSMANLKKLMAAKPNAGYWSVSQNDNDQYCRVRPLHAAQRKIWRGAERIHPVFREPGGPRVP